MCRGRVAVWLDVLLCSPVFCASFHTFFFSNFLYSSLLLLSRSITSKLILPVCVGLIDIYHLPGSNQFLSLLKTSRVPKNLKGDRLSNLEIFQGWKGRTQLCLGVYMLYQSYSRQLKLLTAEYTF